MRRTLRNWTINFALDGKVTGYIAETIARLMAQCEIITEYMGKVIVKQIPV